PTICPAAATAASVPGFTRTQLCDIDGDVALFFNVRWTFWPAVTVSDAVSYAIVSPAVPTVSSAGLLHAAATTAKTRTAVLFIQFVECIAVRFWGRGRSRSTSCADL